MIPSKTSNAEPLFDEELLAVSVRGDGRHRVLKGIHAGRPVVLKCYGRKRGRLRTCARQFGSRLIVHKSSVLPRARCRTEREVLRLWREQGFDVPALLEPAPKWPIRSPCLTMEFVPGPLLSQVLHDPDLTLGRKEALMERFTRMWGERHARALALREPRLLFEHPTFEHVILCEDRLVQFDFEIVFTSKHNLDRLVRRELVGFLRSLAKWSKEALPELLSIVIETYPDRASLEQVRDELRIYGTVPVLGWMTPLTRLLRGARRYEQRSTLVDALMKALPA